MKTKIDLFFKWGIKLDSEYVVPKKEVREVYYAGKEGLMKEIDNRESEKSKEKSTSENAKSVPGGTVHTPIQTEETAVICISWVNKKENPKNATGLSVY